MREIQRIWVGKKELAEQNYYCGQVWDAARGLWRTVTPEFSVFEQAEAYLLKRGPEQRQDVEIIGRRSTTNG